MTQPQTWTTVILPAVAIVVTVVMGLVNRAQARRGPVGAVRWTLEQVNRSQYELRNVGSGDAFEVRVDIEGAADWDGDREFDRFRPNQRSSLLIITAEEMDNPHVRVTWQGPKGRLRRTPKRETWSTEVL